MKPGEEKRQAYLASPEWALLKNAVKSRSGGVCEHCQQARGTQTHHQTYARLYKELLADLAHVCQPCHLYLSGKGPDPRKKFPIGECDKCKAARLAVTVGVLEKDWFVRTHPDKEYSMIVHMHMTEGYQESYIVSPSVVPHISCTQRYLITAVNTNGDPLIWSLKIPDQDGNISPYGKMALIATRKARDQWVSIRANMATQMYELLTPAVELPEPDWSTLPSFDELLKRFFDGKYIATTDHPLVLKEKKGLV
jgi:hypothetical protein